MSRSSLTIVLVVGIATGCGERDFIVGDPPAMGGDANDGDDNDGDGDNEQEGENDEGSDTGTGTGESGTHETGVEVRKSVMRVPPAQQTLRTPTDKNKRPRPGARR